MPLIKNHDFFFRKNDIFFCEFIISRESGILYLKSVLDTQSCVKTRWIPEMAVQPLKIERKQVPFSHHKQVGQE